MSSILYDAPRSKKIQKKCTVLKNRASSYDNSKDCINSYSRPQAPPQHPVEQDGTRELDVLAD